MNKMGKLNQTKGTLARGKRKLFRATQSHSLLDKITNRQIILGSVPIRSNEIVCGSHFDLKLEGEGSDYVPPRNLITMKGLGTITAKPTLNL